MNEQTRLTILHKLSSGEISAEKAARLLSGAEELITVVEVEVKAAPSVEMREETAEIEEPMQVEIEIDDEPKKATKSLRFSAVDDEGNIDINLVIPVPLLNLGKQIGDRFAPTLDGWDWNALDLDINLDTLHVRVSAE